MIDIVRGLVKLAVTPSLRRTETDFYGSASVDDGRGRHTHSRITLSLRAVRCSGLSNILIVGIIVIISDIQLNADI